MNDNKKTSNVMNSLDWYEITKARKMVKANDDSSFVNNGTNPCLHTVAIR